MGENQIATQEATATMTLAQVKGQINLIQQIMKGEMQDGQHYGKVPGCGDKPALLKAGAEKLNLTFRMAPKYETKIIEMGNGHRDYQITTALYHIDSGKYLGSGVGSCSTMEKKYRWRDSEGKDTGRTVPKEYWDLRNMNPAKAIELLGGPGHTTKKVDGIWRIFEKGDKAENPDIADQYNTVYKMAKKRSLVDAVLTVTAASDIFTQDIEEFADNTPAVKPAASGPLPSEKTKPVETEPPEETEDNTSNGIDFAEPPTDVDRISKVFNGKPKTNGDTQEKTINEKQRKLLYARYKSAGVPDNIMKAYIRDNYGKEHSASLTNTELEAILKWVEKYEAVK